MNDGDQFDVEGYVILPRAVDRGTIEKWRAEVEALPKDKWDKLDNQKDKRRENTKPGVLDDIEWGYQEFAACCAPGLQAENLSALRKGCTIPRVRKEAGMQNPHMDIPQIGCVMALTALTDDYKFRVWLKTHRQIVTDQTICVERSFCGSKIAKFVMLTTGCGPCPAKKGSPALGTRSTSTNCAYGPPRAVKNYSRTVLSMRSRGSE